MSAWIVSKLHIDYMVTAIIKAELTDKTPDDLGRMLWAENLASVAYRYPGDGDGERPGPMDFKDSDVKTYTWAETPLLTGKALKTTLGCYDYQSCEHNGWPASESCAIVTKLYNSLDDSGPDAPWGW